jgi:hypothetical protein
LEGLKEAAIDFAEKEGAQVIAGTDARLKVTGKERVIAPGKGSEEREALDAELRRLGVWDEVADLDTKALEKAILEGKWGAGVLEALKALVCIEKRYKVTLKEEDGDD